MILYGFMNYGYFNSHQKAPGKYSNQWNGGRKKMNQLIGGNAAPEFMQKFANAVDMNFASVVCVRYVEHLLGLAPRSIKWPYIATTGMHIDSEEKDIRSKSGGTGIWSDKFQAAVGDWNTSIVPIPPFNYSRAKLLCINLNELDKAIDFNNIAQNKNEKAYLLMCVAAFMAFGNRMFFDTATNPDLVPEDYDETKIYKAILRTTKLRAPFSGLQRFTGLKQYINANVLDFTPVLIKAYQNLIESGQSIQVADAHKLAAAASQFVKGTRFVNT